MVNQSVYRNIGASNHSSGKRHPEDYYATEPKAAELLLEVMPELNNIWECACGEGHLAKVFDDAGKLYKATDLIDRDYGATEDFLFHDEHYNNGDIVTNPPYKLAQEFVEHALELIDTGRYVCMFLKVLFLESRSRKAPSRAMKKYGILGMMSFFRLTGFFITQAPFPCGVPLQHPLRFPVLSDHADA